MEWMVLFNEHGGSWEEHVYACRTTPQPEDLGGSWQRLWSDTRMRVSVWVLGLLVDVNQGARSYAFSRGFPFLFFDVQGR